MSIWQAVALAIIAAAVLGSGVAELVVRRRRSSRAKCPHCGDERVGEHSCGRSAP